MVRDEEEFRSTVSHVHSNELAGYANRKTGSRRGFTTEIRKPRRERIDSP
jgi:hypothetical protein